MHEQDREDFESDPYANLEPELADFFRQIDEQQEIELEEMATAHMKERE